MGKYDYFLDKQISLPARLVAKLLYKKQIGYINQLFAAESGAPLSVLEIGPGKGDLAKLLMDAKHGYTCVDCNPTVVAHLTSLGAHTVKAEVPPIGFEDDRFDLVVLNNVFEHMTSVDVAVRLLAEIHRVLKPQGAVLLMAPNLHGWYFDFYEIDYTHVFEVNTERIRCMFNDSSLEMWKMKNLYGGLDYFPGFFIDLIFRSVFGFLRAFFPMNIKLLKGKIMFHPMLLAIGRKRERPCSAI